VRRLSAGDAANAICNMQYAMAWAFFEATPFLYAGLPAQQLPSRKLFVDYWSHS
jgi:hypothetical protein